MTTTLIRAGWVLTMEPAGDVRHGAVAVSDDRIAAVGPWSELRAAYPNADIRGHPDAILLPGFVNAHGHFSEGLVAGMTEGMTLFEWLDRVIKPLSRLLTADSAYAGTLLKGVEMMRSGVTTISDMFVTAPRPEAPVTPAVVRALRALGLRAVVSYGAEDRRTGSSVAEIQAEHEALAAAAADAPLCGFRLGIGSILIQSPVLLRASVSWTRAHGWPVHVHFQEVREEVVAARLEFGTTSIGHAARLGLLDAPTLAAHCIWLSDEDVRSLAAHRVAVVHNPIANMILASGVCPVDHLRGDGIVVALGTDGAGSNDAQDMKEVVKMASLLQKVHHLDAARLPSRDVLRMATLDGARALGLDAHVGSIAPGKQADLVLFGGDRASLAGTHDPAMAVVYWASARDVSDVWIAGRHVVAKGEVTTVDLCEVAERAKREAETLREALVQ